MAGEAGALEYAAKEMRNIISQLDSLDDLELLVRWQTNMTEAMREFLRKAVPLVQQSTSGRTTALIQVFKSLDGVMQSYVNALDERRKDLCTTVRLRPRPLPADGPQQGDLRIVFNRAQVFLDDRWFEVGLECPA